MNTQAAPPSQFGQSVVSVSYPSNAKQAEPSMVEQLQQRRQALLVELRDTEQALQSLEAHPEFEQIMRLVIKAHRY